MWGHNFMEINSVYKSLLNLIEDRLIEMTERDFDEF